PSARWPRRRCSGSCSCTPTCSEWSSTRRTRGPRGSATAGGTTTGRPSSVVTTTNSAGSSRRPGEAPARGAVRAAHAREGARALGDGPILPAPSAMSLHQASLERLLADLARGDKSQHADVLREVSDEQGVALAEIARRAQFTLACLLLPASGTF